MSNLIGQKLVKNANIQKCDIFGDFETLWVVENHRKSLIQQYERSFSQNSQKLPKIAKLELAFSVLTVIQCYQMDHFQ